MWLNHVILGILWIIYCILHSALAGGGIKKKLQQALKKNYRYYRIFYTIFAFLSLIAVLYFQLSIPSFQIFEPSAISLAIGIVIGFSGLVLMIICISKYFFGLSGLRSLVHEGVSNELEITGIHKFVRHPLYLGTFVFLWGLFLSLPYISLLIANTIITIYTLIGIGLEEKKLVNEFGDSYVKYKSEVPMLLPLVKIKRKP